jgi:hypothetical protein
MLDNKNIQKIFSLGDIRKKQLLGEVPQRTRETYREYGYFGGGGDGFNGTTSISRIDFSNDTQNANLRGKLPSIIQFGGGCGNSNFGYFGAGTFQFQGESKIYRIDYANDGANASLRSNISGNINGTRTQATGNSNFGYWGGGRTQTSPFGSTSGVSRLNYATDTTNTSIRGPLTGSKYSSIALGNSNFGYFCGGVGPNLSGVDRIDYSNDSVLASRRGNLINGNQNSLATGNSNFGYINNDGSTVTQRIQYSSDTQTSINRGNTTYGANFKLATGNSNFGYFGGGSNQPGPIYRTIIDRIDYANDTATAQTRGPINYSTFTGGSAATSSHSFGGSPNSSFASNFTFPTVPNAGYFGGGTDGTNNLATIDKVDYANDTATASVRSALSVARFGLAATGNSNFGYFIGGFPGPTSIIDRIEYASDTQSAVLRTNQTIARHRTAATGNSNFGYSGGGINPAGFVIYSTIDRTNYSNDTTSARGPLSSSRYHLSSVGNNNFGYFGGGNPGSLSTIDRLDYSNDVSQTIQRSRLSTGRILIGTAGNSNFGYFGGGSPGPISTVDRIDYSNDSATASIRGPLSSARSQLAATGNSNFGYFGGGETPSRISTTDRINYSNDTAVASIRGPLSTAKSALSATSPLAYGGAAIYFTNPLPEVLQKQIEFDDSNTLDLPFKRVLGSYGYFGGGGLTTRVDRIDYSNDTSTASVRGSLQEQRERAASTGTNSYGYIAMGRSGNPIPVRNTYQRNDYSNDTANFIIRGSFNLALIDPAATGNSNFGYFGGGSLVPGSAISSISRLDYSTDNTTPPIRSFLSQNTYILAATGNSNFGYFGGGLVFPSPIYSTVNRLNYSTDTATTSVRGPLSLARQALAATGNSNFGYFGGGSGPVSTVERIDYSNDTATASVRGPLSLARFNSAATGNSNFGYFGGGSTPGPSSRSTVERIDYSNDTETASVRGPLSLARQSLAATTNARNS